MFVTLSLLTFALLLVVASAWGRLVVAALGAKETPAALVFAVGLGIASYVLMLLAVAGLFSLPWVGAVSAVPLIAAGPLRRRPLPASATESPAGDRALRFTLVGAMALCLLLCLYPPLHPDSGIYHLPLAAQHATRGDLAPALDVRYPVVTQLMEMLYAVGCLGGGVLLAHLLQWSLFVVTSLCLYRIGTELVGRRFGLCCALVWAGNPQVVYLSTSAYVDVALAAYCTAGLCALVLCRGGRGPVAVAGLLCGLAAATKYPGLVAIAVGALVLYVRQREQVLRFVGWALAAAAPWYVYNLVVAHDPVFPIGQSLLGPSFWSVEDLDSLLAAMRAQGTGLGPGALLATPVRLVAAPSPYMMTAPYSFALLAAPFAVLSWWRDRWVRWCVVALVLGYAAWFYTAQVGRYLMPLVPLLCLAAVAGARALAGRITWLRSSVVQAGVLAILVGVALAYPAYRLWRLGPPPLTTAARADFLAEHFVTYPAYWTIEALRTPAPAVYALFDEHMRAHYSGRFVGDWFGRGRYRDLQAHAGEPPALRAHLNELGVDHLVVDTLRTDPAVLAGLGPQHGFRLLLELPGVLAFEVGAPRAVERLEPMTPSAGAPIVEGAVGRWRIAAGSTIELDTPVPVRVDVRRPDGSLGLRLPAGSGRLTWPPGGGELVVEPAADARLRRVAFVE